jgi:GTPase SAR1 family protein
VSAKNSYFTCPYCIKKSPRGSVIYHCRYYNTGTSACDSDISAATKTQPTCSGCGRPAYQQVCPECRTDLPGAYAQSDNKIIALVGPTASGKSTYLAALINELMNQVGEDLDLTVEFCDDLTQARYQNEFYDPLYARKTILGQTPPLAINRNLHDRPLVFHIAHTRTSRSRGRTGARAGKRSERATLVFFDSAGQDATMGADMNRFLRYLKDAAGIIFTVDPAALGAAGGDVILQPAPGNIQPRDSYLVIQDATKILRDETGLIKAPVAVVLTKADLLKPTSADPSMRAQVLSKSDFSPGERETVDEFVRALFNRWNLRIDNYMRQNYEKYAFFLVSSLGRSPMGQEVASEGIHPKRVAEPLMWILAELSLLRS